MKPIGYNNDNSRRGFTLVELLVALVVFSFVIAGIYELYIHMHRAWLMEDLKAGMQQSARVAMDNLVRESMMMGYGASEGDKKITTAKNNEIEFKVYEKDYKGTTPNLYSIKYKLDGKKLMRKVVACIANGNDAVDVANIADSDYASANDRTLATNVTNLSFAYYDKDGNAMVPDAGTDTQDERDDIRRITITLVVESDEFTNPANKQLETKTMKLTADLSPRNLWEGDVGFDITKPTGVPASDVRVRDAQRVEPANSCGNGVLKVKWVANTDGDLAGYLIKWGTTSGNYTNIKDVPVTHDSHPTETEIYEGIEYTPYYTSDATVNKYYVVVQTYDYSHNYSDLDIATDEVVAAAPDPDETSFDTGTTDSSCDLPKPLPPTGLTVKNSDPDAGSTYDPTCPNNAVKLVWTRPTSPNVTGYRIYRSNSPITTFPINPDGVTVKEIAWETANGGTLSYGSSTYVDNDSSLIGCKTYYYAICAVTCDTSRIMGGPADPGTPYHDGGRYVDTDYATVSGEPHDNVPPTTPDISGTAGYKRVFLQVQWPSDNDYAYTKIYYKQGAANAYDLPGTVVNPDTGERTFSASELIPDHQIGYTTGTFKNYGTSAEHTIIFNCTSGDIADDAQPQLLNGTNYTFVAVSYDKCGNASSQTLLSTTFAELCGDDPCGAPKWSATATDGTPVGYPFMWVDDTSTQKDASLWAVNSETSEIEAPLGLKWTDVNKTDASTALDFAGYSIKRRVHGTGSGAWTTPVSTGQWNNYVISTISEGESYDFCAQAADCVYYNITPDDTVCCTEDWDPINKVCADPKTYDWVYTQGHNISPDNMGPTDPASYDYIRWVTVSPGRIKLASTPAVTEGVYHNKVKFYIQNTSKGTLTIRNMRFIWGNSAARLKYVTIGGGESTTPVTSPISAGLLANSSRTYIAGFPEVQIQDLATAPGSPSVRIPVTLEFTSASGVANATSDMRGRAIALEIRFRNDSMPNSIGATGIGATSYLDDFSTGDLEGAGGGTPIAFWVTNGPAFRFVIQNKPLNPTVAFDVMSTTTITTMPPGYPEVDGLQNVIVTGSSGVRNVLGNIVNSAQVSNNPAQFENITAVVAYYAKRDPETDPVTPNPAGLTFTSITTVKTGSNYSFTIPGDEDIGAWYYLKAYSNIGNFGRIPENLDGYFYYKQLGFDPCHVTPARPEGLGGTPTMLNWSSVTTYTDGVPVASADTITYDVYRRNGLLSTDPLYLLDSGLTDTTYTDSAYSSYSSMPLVYMVKATNTCPTSSDFSNKLVICPTGSSGSAMDVYPAFAYLGDPITVNTAVCGAVGDGNSDGWAWLISTTTLSNGTTLYDYFRIYENGDTGISVPISVTTIRQDTIHDDYDFYIRALGTSDMVGTVRLNITTGYFNTYSYGGVWNNYIPDGNALATPITVTVAVNPCDNVPRAPTGLTASRTGANVSLRWNGVTTNTDGTPAKYPSDGSVEDVTYQVWVELDAVNSPGVFAVMTNPVTKNADGTYSVSFKSSDVRRYFVRAKDKCSTNDAEEEANSTSAIVTI